MIVRIRVNQDINSMHGDIKKGDEFTAVCKIVIGRPWYKITEGKYKGYHIPKEFCKVIQEVPVYSQKQYDNLSTFYEGRLEALRKENSRLEIELGKANEKIKLLSQKDQTNNQDQMGLHIEIQVDKVPEHEVEAHIQRLIKQLQRQQS